MREFAEDRIGLNTLHPLRTAFGAASQTAVINHYIFRQRQFIVGGAIILE